MTFKEKYENANTIPIVNNIKYNDWLSSKMHTDKKNFDEFMLLTRKNVKTFKRLFAEQNGCYTTWYRSWIWIINFKGYDFYLCTSKRGTTIELSYDGSYEEFRDDDVVGDYCIEFVMDLIEDIKINEPSYIPTNNHIHINEKKEKEIRDKIDKYGKKITNHPKKSFIKKLLNL